MTCAAAREAILDFAREVSMAEDVRLAVEKHLDGCANCAAEFERQRDLTAALSAPGGRSEDLEGVSGNRRAASAGIRRPDPGHHRYRSWNRSGQLGGFYALATAAVIALAVWLRQPDPRRRRLQMAVVNGGLPCDIAGRLHGRRRLTETRRRRRWSRRTCLLSGRFPVRAAAGRRAAPPKQVTSFEFITLPGAAGLPDLESGSVVRIAVPVGALPEYGLDIVQGGSKTTVDADVLVGQDGLARAIRLVERRRIGDPGHKEQTMKGRMAVASADRIGGGRRRGAGSGKSPVAGDGRRRCVGGAARGAGHAREHGRGDAHHHRPAVLGGGHDRVHPGAGRRQQDREEGHRPDLSRQRRPDPP